MAYKVIYENIAEIDDDDVYTVPTSSSKKYSFFSGQIPINFASFESDGFLLDDNIEFAEYGDWVGFITDEVANDDGEFLGAPLFNIYSKDNDAYNSSGITLFFYRSAPIEIDVTYHLVLEDTNKTFTYNLQDNEKKFGAIFLPAVVENWNSATISIKKGAPNEFAKLYGVRFGETIEFTKFKSFEIHKEISLVSEDLPYGTAAFEAIYDKEFLPQQKQKIKIYNDEDFVGTYYLDTVKRVTDKQYYFEAFDTIGMLDYYNYDGGVWVLPTTQNEIVQNISNSSKVPIYFNSFHYGSEEPDENIFGYIPFGSCRVALQKICYALGYAPIVNNDGSVTIKDVWLSGNQAKLIPKERILGNSVLDKNKLCVGYKLRYIDYVPTDLTQTNTEVVAKTAYSSKGKKVAFEKPVQEIRDIQVDGKYLDPEDLLTAVESIVNGTFVVPLLDNLTIWGYYYKSVENNLTYMREDLPKNATGEIKDFPDMTVFTESGKVGFVYGVPRLNTAILSKGKVTAKIILDGESVGDTVTVETAFDGYVTGVITDMVYKSPEIAEIEVTTV